MTKNDASLWVTFVYSYNPSTNRLEAKYMSCTHNLANLFLGLNRGSTAASATRECPARIDTIIGSMTKGSTLNFETVSLQTFSWVWCISLCAETLVQTTKGFRWHPCPEKHHDIDIMIPTANMVDFHPAPCCHPMKDAPYHQITTALRCAHVTSKGGS